VVDQAGAVTAGGDQDPIGVDPAAGCFHTGDLAALGVDGGGFGVLVDVTPCLAQPLAKPQTTASWRTMPPGGWNMAPWMGKVMSSEMFKRRHQLLGFLGVDEVAFHAVKLGRGDGHAGRLHGRFAVHQVQVAAVVEHQVEIQLFGQHRPQVQRLLVKRYVILRALVGPHDGRVAPAPPNPM
jgi:hypothetical protein